MSLDRTIKDLEMDLRYLISKRLLLQMNKNSKDEEKTYLTNTLAGRLRRYWLLSNRKYFELKSMEGW